MNCLAPPPVQSAPQAGAQSIPPRVCRPPGMLMPLVNAIGEEGVLRLLEKRGGTLVYIPGKKLTPLSGIGRELGLDAAACERLRALMGNEQYRVPLCRQWRAQVYRRAGLSYTQIARKLGVTDIAVHGYLRDTGMTHPQLSLPL